MAPFLAGGAVTFYLINSAQEAALKSTYSTRPVCHTFSFNFSGSADNPRFRSYFRQHVSVATNSSTTNDLIIDLQKEMLHTLSEPFKSDPRNPKFTGKKEEHH
ncbi:hypothetical protein BG015_010858 [Linnemannia schmuckeri]|uniref:Uncharacterized protein n=1 Tax=Linnemannia schmuckeri TaxID=64567 RepID=A0A9P5S4W3_9FUNG|nr:hypothetical protein BG015_010858 [Linnemannia schmuckeri]